MSKEIVYNQLKGFLDNYTRSLINALEKGSILVKDKTDADKYHLSTEQAKLIARESPVPTPILTQLFQLRNIATNVCNVLYPGMSGNGPIPFGDAILKLEEQNAIVITWKDKRNAIQTFNGLESMANDAESSEILGGIIEENDIQITRLTINILEYFGSQQVDKYFSEYFYQRNNRDAKPSDFMLNNGSLFYSPLIFEIKYRRIKPLPEVKIIRDAVRRMANAATVGSPFPYLFLIIFTDEPFQTLGNLKIKFNNLLLKLEGVKDYRDQIKFVPVSTVSLHLIKEAFEEFKRENIENKLEEKFVDQSPPPNFPERNDRICNVLFPVKGSEFNITIRPNNTPFWRFGFRFSKDDRFPPIAGGRHGDINFPDVHLSVGEIVDTATNRWGEPTHLSITRYNIEPIFDGFESMLDYKGEDVLFTVDANADASAVKFKAIVNGRSLGMLTLDLREYKYCKLMAWADHTKFELDTTIEVKRKAISGLI